MSADKLLSLLHGVKRTGERRWIARCPSHQDRSPSLAIRELPDGKVLVHCFSGCSAAEVLASVSLSLEDLFPEKQEGYTSARERLPFSSADILRCISAESLLVSIAAINLAQGMALSEIDRKRLLIASSRLQAAAEFLQ